MSGCRGDSEKVRDRDEDRRVNGRATQGMRVTRVQITDEFQLPLNAAMSRAG